VDISLVDDVPTVVQVLQALHSNFVIGRACGSSSSPTLLGRVRHLPKLCTELK
jgi:hypothetical protein